MQRGWEQLCAHGEAPASLPYTRGELSAADSRRYDAINSAKVRRVGQRIHMPDGSVLCQWGVQAVEPIAACENIGTYVGREIKGGLGELLAEEAVYLLAGHTPTEAEDAYSVSGVRLADGSIGCISARGPDYYGSLLAYINCSGKRRDLVNCAWHDNSNVIYATRPLARGDMLCIDYGVQYYAKMNAHGIAIGTPGEPDEELPFVAADANDSWLLAALGHADAAHDAVFGDGFQDAEHTIKRIVHVPYDAPDPLETSVDMEMFMAGSSPVKALSPPPPPMPQAPPKSRMSAWILTDAPSDDEAW